MCAATASCTGSTRQLALPGGQQALLTDTVGFIRKLPAQLIAAFRATLEEIAEADLVLHVLDASHPTVVEQSQTVLETLVALRAANRPRLTVLNKIDLLDKGAEEVPALAQELGLAGNYVAISARAVAGLDQLLRYIAREIQGGMAPLEALIPYDHGELVALWHEHGVVEREEHEETGTRITGRLPTALVARVAPFQLRGRERAVGVRRSGERRAKQ
jgi:GTPase